MGAKIGRGLTLHSKALKSLGAEREDEMNEREAEVKDAIERAARIKEKTQIDVPWQIFCGLEPPGGATKIFDMSTYEDGKDKKKKDKED